MEEYRIDSQYILFTRAGVSVLSLSHPIGNVSNPQSVAVRVGGREIFPCYRGNRCHFITHWQAAVGLHWAKGIWIIHATVQLTPASGLFSAQGILTAWLANDELFVKGTIGQISVFPSWALKKIECFVYMPGCFCEAHFRLWNPALNWKVISRTLQGIECALLGTERQCKKQGNPPGIHEGKATKTVKTTPAVASVVKIPYYQAANQSRYLKPSHFYSLQV